ncbi:MAG TPA: acetoin utilization protein AcuC [Candidatus Limnocylindrales bacterium]|nr:acetoin utilization protein AcuC [Candidatus Limnocylindrales bacterium]
MSAERPLLVYGPRSTTYDFGPAHPLTPRRFGPGISLLETLGAVAGLAPEPATDEELAWAHDRAYIEHVKASGAAPAGARGMGIGPGDTPAFAGMHEASAAVAGGSIRAMEAILRGDVLHAFHPGGGLHHAMPARASGFCVYDDVGLAIARARRDGLRVMYLDFDVHHGDGVQAIHWMDPDVLTVSIHESGHSLFPGTGFADELGGPGAEGSKVNIALDPGTGEQGWVEALEIALPPLAAAFRPQVIVSQHGADSHAWDPLAHLRVTTTAMGRAAHLVDGLAHQHAGGRWLATGGGGYDVYRVVPRDWALVWLAQSHVSLLGGEGPGQLAPEWRARWAAEAEHYGQSPIPTTLDDEPNLGLPRSDQDDRLDGRAAAAAHGVLARALPLIEARAARSG